MRKGAPPIASLKFQIPIPSVTRRPKRRPAATASAAVAAEEQEEEEDEEEVKPQKPPQRRLIMHGGCNYVALLAGWLAILTVGLIFLALRSPAAPLMIVGKREARKWHIEFKRNSSSKGRFPLPARMNFAKMLRYDVCCNNGDEFHCHHEGVFISWKEREFYINSGNTVSSNGEERCIFLWAEESGAP